MGDTDGLDYKDIAAIVRGALNFGRLRLHSKALMFKYQKTGKIDQYSANDISEVQWMRASRGFQLLILTTGNHCVKFVGFEEKKKEEIKTFIKDYYNAEFVEKEPFVKGWNWGKVDFNGPLMAFRNENKTIFEIPLTDVSAATVNKNEVTIEFHQDDDNDLNLVEMRFYVPQTGDKDDDSEIPADKFHKSVMKFADVIQATGDVIIKFQEVLLQTPRGRYDVDMYPTFLRLHGKSYDYKIPYSTIIRLFLLPHSDQRSVYFVITTDPPIRQGQTRYPHIVIQFVKDHWSDLTLEMDEETIATKYEGKLQKEMAGPTYETFSKVMKFVVGQKIFVPGSFVSSTGAQAVACSHKANAGHLYPLERGFMYVVKPPVHIRFDEVATVNFSRVASGVGQSRSFDLEIDTKTGAHYVFASIEKREYSKLFDFLKSKKIRIQNTKGGDENFQDDFGGGSGSDNEMPDHYLEKMKAEGEERDSDEESTDEDFVAGETPDTSPSSSSETGEDGQEGKKKKKKVVKETEISGSGKKKERGSPKEKREPKEKKEPKEKRRKGKAERDPNKPKKPATAYFLWLGDNRAGIKEKYPGISITEIAKKAGEMWRALSADDRQKYDGDAKKLKEKYDEAMAQYNKEQRNVKRPSPPKKKEPSAPKPPPKTKSVNESHYKSKARIDTDDDFSNSSLSEDDKPLKQKSPPPPSPKEEKTDNKRKREEPAASSKKSDSDAEDSDVQAPESDSSAAKSPPPKRSMRGAPVQEVGELPDDMSDEAEYTDGEAPLSSSGSGSD